MERDDLIVNDSYAVNAKHSEEAGVAIRKKIWKVTALLSIITIAEVLVGVWFPKHVVSEGTWTAIKLYYIVLTLVKAGYIVMIFMHLGDEKKAFKWVILAPYILFILYLLFICLTEGIYVLEMLKNTR
ncbi:MAG: cytochrome C oxidase subunit IV family protein [Flavobacteriales bacterium]